MPKPLASTFWDVDAGLDGGTGSLLANATLAALRACGAPEHVTTHRHFDLSFELLPTDEVRVTASTSLGGGAIFAAARSPCFPIVLRRECNEILTANGGTSVSDATSPLVLRLTADPVFSRHVIASPAPPPASPAHVPAVPSSPPPSHLPPPSPGPHSPPSPFRPPRPFPPPSPLPPQPPSQPPPPSPSPSTPRPPSQPRPLSPPLPPLPPLSPLPPYSPTLQSQLSSLITAASLRVRIFLDLFDPPTTPPVSTPTSPPPMLPPRPLYPPAPPPPPAHPSLVLATAAWLQGETELISRGLNLTLRSKEHLVRLDRGVMMDFAHSMNTTHSVLARHITTASGGGEGDRFDWLVASSIFDRVPRPPPGLQEEEEGRVLLMVGGIGGVLLLLACNILLLGLLVCFPRLYSSFCGAPVDGAVERHIDELKSSGGGARGDAYTRLDSNEEDGDDSTHDEKTAVRNQSGCGTPTMTMPVLGAAAVTVTESFPGAIDRPVFSKARDVQAELLPTRMTARQSPKGLECAAPSGRGANKRRLKSLGTPTVMNSASSSLAGLPQHGGATVTMQIGVHCPTRRGTTSVFAQGKASCIDSISHTIDSTRELAAPITQHSSFTDHASFMFDEDGPAAILASETTMHTGRLARTPKKPPLPNVPMQASPTRGQTISPSATSAPAGFIAAQAQAMLQEAAANKGYVPQEWYEFTVPADGEPSLASLALKARVPPLEELGLRRAQRKHGIVVPVAWQNMT